MDVFDPTPCALGEGPLWHPRRGQLFWFDILGRTLLTRDGGVTRRWTFAEMVSAAGWIDEDRLLIASETRLFVFDLTDGRERDLAALEPDDPRTRSNDGRADLWGGFWIGTMGKSAEPGRGAIYRYFRGTLRKLHGGLSIPNSIAFAPDRPIVYFTDTPGGLIQRQQLDPQTGWPTAEAEPWLDLTAEGLHPDGSVCDADGRLWNAQWGAGRIAAYDPDGRFERAVAVAAPNVTCPAFGGPGFTTLHATTARQGIAPARLADEPAHGQTFATDIGVIGCPEPAVIP